MWSRAPRVAVFAVLLLGCGGESATPTSGGDGGSATTQPSTSTRASAGSGANGSGGDGSGGAPSRTSSSSGGGAPECVPLTKLGGDTPTPGRCANDAPVTCDFDGHLVTKACKASEKCITYPVEEYRRDPSTNAWSPARMVTWAGCVPADAVACDFAWDTTHFAPTMQAACDVDDRTQCVARPMPDDQMNTAVGSPQGFVERLPCPSGTICAGAETVGALACIPEDAPACTGAEPLCAEDGSGVSVCVGAWESPPGHREVHGCDSGASCRPGCSTGGPSCVGDDEVACDRTTFANACSGDATAAVFCNGCYTIHQSCASCQDDHGHVVPCRCSHSASANPTSQNTCQFSQTGPVCVPAAAAECDRAVDADHCAGHVAHRCLGQWQTFDCATTGGVCMVANGIAGCARSGASACSPDPAGRCDGDVVTHCCGACGVAALWSFLGPDATHCVPGFETTYDCSAGGDSCQILGGDAVCSP